VTDRTEEPRVNTPLDLAPRPSSHPTVPAAEELDLTALLELFVLEEDAGTTARPSFRASGARLLGWAQHAARRAARWGAVAEVTR
jgi:hypothetical protein